MCARVRVCNPIRRGQVIRRRAAEQPRCLSPSDKRELPASITLFLSQRIGSNRFGETLPFGASRELNDMGDRVALLLLAVAASALAAEVSESVLSEKKI